MKDSEVIAQIKSGNENALEFLYKKNYKSILKMIVSNNGNEQEAKDIFQEAIIFFWQKANKADFVLSSRIGTYLYAVSKNLWLKELDRKSRHSSEQKDTAEEMTMDKQERSKVIEEAINSLGSSCRKILMYYYFDGLSMQDIATRLGLANSDTAKTKKYKCKERLFDIIKTKYKATDFLD
jgi:RNA polymerase sigma factor (sigma-70 family)